MKWIKKGLIYQPDIALWWQQKYSILPTPIVLENVIRVFFSTTCKDLIGRITYIDLDKNNPSKIVSLPNDFIIESGEIGCFDENGLNPSSINLINNKWYLYYAGYQRHYSSPYSIFTGLLISNNLNDFSRYSKIPILDRNEDEFSIRSAPTVIFDEKIYKMWYVSNQDWINVPGEIHKNKLYPKYALKYAVSSDGIKWNVKQGYVFLQNENEFGFGRPYIYKKDKTYYLFYSIRSFNKSYRIGHATSTDGINWIRDDENTGIDVSNEGWDSEMICYPAVIDVGDKTYMFYNGNNNGETGFGYAELIND